MKKWMIGCILCSIFAFLFAGCGSQGAASDSGKASSNQEPVTLKIAMRTGYLTEDAFRRYVADPVKKKYPYITAEQVIMQGNMLLPERVAAGELPDMTVLTNVDLNQLTDLQLDFALDDLMKKNNLSSTQFKPETIEAIKFSSGKEQLIGLPLKMQFSALYYNKDIFDKFGVPYPKDGMTWEDAREVARKVTRKEGDVQYRGLEPMLVSRVASQLALPYVDPKTNKAVLNTDQWKRVFELMKSIYDISGNNKMTFNETAVPEFTKDRTLAMLAGPNYFYNGGLDKLPDFNWDMVSHPTFKEAPGMSTKVDVHTISIMSTSKHKDEAFKVITTVVSDEVQMDFSRQGDVSPLKDTKYKEVFAQDIPFLKGKNVQAALMVTPAKSIELTKYFDAAKSQIHTAMTDVVKKGVDINTALNNAEENTNKKIAEMQASEGTKAK